MTNLFRKRQTVIVAHHLTTPGKVTTVGTIARVTGHARIGAAGGRNVVLTTIETFGDHKTWNVPESYLAKAPRPWSAYEKVTGSFDNSAELAAIAEAEARQAAEAVR